MIPRIKICGIRTPEIARAAALAGADAIGLVFADASPRRIEFDDALHIAPHVGPFIDIVGLFVDHTPRQIRSIVRDLPLTTIQLHGQYDAADIDSLSPHRVIRAVHFHPEDAPAMLRYWEEIHQELPNLAGILLDTPPPATNPPSDSAAAPAAPPKPGQSAAPPRVSPPADPQHRTAPLPGGSGQSFDWAALRHAIDQAQPTIPIILAGGLHPGNVAHAITTVRPWAVDVSSGVESSRGIKCPQKIIDFCHAVRSTPPASPASAPLVNAD
jgi:phosphoribosylanthranilate isomerase